MTFLNEVCNSLQAAGVRYALVGGYAVALHGAVRGTVDVDFVIDWGRDTLVQSQRALESLGLRSRLPIDANDVFDFRDEYIRKRNLIAWNFRDANDPSRCVDLIITFDLRGHRRRTRATPGGDVRVLDCDALIAMKEASGRPQDLADVAALKKLKERS